MAKREIAERIDGELTVEASPPCPNVADVRRDLDAAHDRRAVRSLVLSIRDFPAMKAPPARAPAAVPSADERRQVQRDLHDGVQNELVALVVKLALEQEDAGIPPTLAKTLAGLKARAQAALDTVRDIVRGTYPPQLADFGLARALRAQAARGPVDASLEGAGPRGIEEAQAAVYFACSEAIQDVATHAGRAPQIKLGRYHSHGTLAARIADDGRGFDPAQTADGAGLRNIRERLQPLDGTLRLTSTPRHATVLTVSLPWPSGSHATNDDDAPDSLPEMRGRLVCGSCDRSKPGRLM